MQHDAALMLQAATRASGFRVHSGPGERHVGPLAQGSRAGGCGKSPRPVAQAERVFPQRRGLVCTSTKRTAAAEVPAMRELRDLPHLQDSDAELDELQTGCTRGFS